MSPRGIASYENRLLVLLFFTFGFVFFDRQALNFLFPFIARDFGLTNTHLGKLASALALTWALSGLAIGALSDRMGSRKPLLVATVIVFSVASLLSGLAGGFATMMACRLLMGVAEGPVLPLAQSLMVSESSESRRGMNMGLLQSSAVGLIGGLLGPPVIVGVAEHFGWRTSFYVSCIPGLILAALIWRYVREPKAPRPAPSPAGERHRILEPLKFKNVWLGVAISCFFVSWFIVFITFVPTYLVQGKGFRPEQMAMVLTVIGAAQVVWGFVVPALSDRIGRKPAMVIFCLLSLGTPLSVILLDDPISLAAGVALTFAGPGCFTLFMATIPAETVPARYLATSMGLVMGIGELAGGVLAPTLAGVAADAYGPASPFWICTVGAAVASALSLFLDETAPAALRRRGATLHPETSTHEI